jgi:NADH-quinone oxidoreductase subunit L
MFEYSPIILQIITIIGAVTCLFAALIAIAQTDIKKIIAYSTCSQLGYMFFACGVSAYHLAMFHLVTHGFFKALLFLSAGSVIHACHEQDVFKMGGLRKKMPVTYANFWIGSLAIIGIYPFAGFYSKDLILEAAYGAGGVGDFAYILGIIAALLTAIYSLKIIILTFHGKTKLDKDRFDQTHESPKIMNIPLLILVAGTLFSGMFGYYILGVSNPYKFFVGSIFNLQGNDNHEITLMIEILPMIVGFVGIMLGVYIYKGTISSAIAGKMKYSYCVIKNKFFVDELYNKVFIQPTRCLSCFANMFDSKIIDRFGPNGFSCMTKAFSKYVCKIQTGYIFNYTFYIIGALLVCITFFIAQYLYGLGGI